jgi:hypothetical protein
LRARTSRTEEPKDPLRISNVAIAILIEEHQIRRDQGPNIPGNFLEKRWWWNLEVVTVGDVSHSCLVGGELAVGAESKGDNENRQEKTGRNRCKPLSARPTTNDGRKLTGRGNIAGVSLEHPFQL